MSKDLKEIEGKMEGSSNWGGKRKGAGRKAEILKVTLSFTLPKEVSNMMDGNGRSTFITIAILKELKKNKNLDASKLEMVQRYLNVYQKKK